MKYNIAISKTILCSIVLFMISCSAAGAVEYTVRCIWDEGKHHGFTDLIRFKGRFYCSFRDGDGHVPQTKGGAGNGIVRILRSEDGEKWESIAVLKKKNYDLRDPKFSQTPDGRLLLTVGGSIYLGEDHGTKMNARDPLVSFSDNNGDRFSDLVSVDIDDSVRSKWDWIWRVTWHKGIGYAVIWRAVNDKMWGNDRNYSIVLVKTVDGLRYEPVKEFDFPLEEAPNEATVRFDKKDVMYMLVRQQKGVDGGLFGRASAPYADWDWKNTGKRLGGPNFIFLPSGNILVGSRAVDKGGTAGLYTIDGNGKMIELLLLPGGGDASYIGLSVHDGILWASYYSGTSKQAQIYLAKIILEDIEVKINQVLDVSNKKNK